MTIALGSPPASFPRARGQSVSPACLSSRLLCAQVHNTTPAHEGRGFPPTPKPLTPELARLFRVSLVCLHRPCPRARRWSPLSCLRSWRPPLPRSPPALGCHSPGKGRCTHAQSPRPSPARCSSQRQPPRAGTLAASSAGTGAGRGGTSAGGAAWMPPAPAPGPSPAAGLRPGLRKGAPPALGAHQPTVMELATTAGRLRPAPARPSRPPVPLWPVQAPPCQPVLRAGPLSSLLPRDPVPRLDAQKQGQPRRKTPVCQEPWV